MARLYGLDALRGIAAIAVAFHHLTRIYDLPVPPFSPAVAVDLFFILSGFVMTRTYEERLKGGLGAGEFLILRYRRLFPPMAIGSTIGLVWALSQGTYPLAAYALILAFLPAVWMSACFLLNGPAWSLFVEVLANYLHGAIFAKLSTDAIFRLWAALSVVTWPLFLAGYIRWTEGFEGIVTLIPREVACYLVGILIFRRFGDSPLEMRPSLAVTAFGALLVIAMVHPVLEIAAVLIGAPLVIRGALGMGRSQVAAWAGALSFPLYAVHVPVIRLARAMDASIIVAGFAALVVAVIVMRFERPLVRPMQLSLLRRKH